MSPLRQCHRYQQPHRDGERGEHARKANHRNMFLGRRLLSHENSRPRVSSNQALLFPPKKLLQRPATVVDAFSAGLRRRNNEDVRFAGSQIRSLSAQAPSESAFPATLFVNSVHKFVRYGTAKRTSLYVIRCMDAKITFCEDSGRGLTSSAKLKGKGRRGTLREPKR